jgi:NAD(P)-dependent dehydrogenase (short-subunit alcohol dehydrogenase family)
MDVLYDFSGQTAIITGGARGIGRNLRFGTRQQLLRSTYCARSPESEFRLSRWVQPTQRQDVLAQPGSAVFSRRSDQQTEPQCGSLEDKLLKRNEPYS